MYALLSVSDKTGIVELARGLHAQGVKLLSTGGTARLLEDAGLPVIEVAQHTGFAEMLDGRVKTLHPKVHGGLLARREMPAHMQALAQNDIPCIDILVVNLYPFEATVARPGCTMEDAIENIDIGGPAMVRSAAKNWQDVAVLTDSAQYAVLLQQLAAGGIARSTRFEWAVAAFNRIAQYDAAISQYLSGISIDGAKSTFPAQFNAQWLKVQDLRYGENPHQRAAFYKDVDAPPSSLATGRQLQGKELSYNNIADADAAWECVKSLTAPGCVIIKHANPCGVATAESAAQAYTKAFQTDPVSAFGGIIAFNVPLDEAAAALVAKQFVEVLIAPAFDAGALAVFAAKPNVRLMQIDAAAPAQAAGLIQTPTWHLQRVGGGLLVQDVDTDSLSVADFKVVTDKAPTPTQMQDMLFAWKVARFVKSNAIVYVGGGMTLGVGAGQMSRVDSARIAKFKAELAGLSLQGSAVASDAFFPFRDGLDVVCDAGASCVIQPGGSMRDDEVIAAANERGIAMVMTGIRHFRH